MSVYLHYMRNGKAHDLILQECKESMTSKNVITLNGRNYVLNGSSEETDFLITNIEELASHKTISDELFKARLIQLGAEESTLDCPLLRSAQKVDATISINSNKLEAVDNEKKVGKWVQKSNSLLPSRKLLVAEKYWNLFVQNEKVEKDHTPLKNFLGKHEEFDSAIHSKNFQQFLSCFDHLTTDAVFLINGGEELKAIPPLGTITQKERLITSEDLKNLEQYMKDTSFSGVISLSDRQATYTISSSKEFEHSPFAIHSVAKVFTGILAIMMIQDGIIKKECLTSPIGDQLDEDVLKMLTPAIREHVKHATLHEVMIHEGGLGDHTVAYENALNEALANSKPLPTITSPKDLLIYANDENGLLKKNEDPYSNLGILLVGLAIQHHCNKNAKQPLSYNEILQKKIIEPAKISTFSSTMPTNGQFNITDPASQFVYGSPAGGYWTRAEDLQKFGQWVNNKCATDTEFRQLLETYGQEFYSKENQEVRHAGTWTAATAFFSTFLKNGITIAVVSDQGNFAADKAYGNIVDYMLTEECEQKSTSKN